MRASSGSRAAGIGLRFAAGGAVLAGAVALMPGAATGYALVGGALGLDQRDVRVFDNFGDATANDNATPDAGFPGYVGAELAIWKATVEWGSELHGDGQGDPQQPGDLGSGGANFDASFQGNALGIGSKNDNVHSEIAGSGGGVLAFCELPIADGWRIRYYASETWSDGPGAPLPGEQDLQGVAAHEYGHALGLAHSSVVGATMYPSASAGGYALRSLAADDVAGLQAVYGAKSPAKPRITNATVDAVAGTITLFGVNFAAAQNELWFPRDTPTAAGADPVLRVSGIASTDGGTRIAAALPVGAGPGDVLVRIPGGGHASLSNAWPFQPLGTGPGFTAPVITGVQPSVLAAVQVAPRLVDVTGTGFQTLVAARIAGVALDQAAVAVHSDTSLTLDVPLVGALGPVALELVNAFGVSAPGTLILAAPDPPALALDSPFVFSSAGLTLAVGGAPGTAWALAGSLVLAPSVLPGVLHADIGGGFSSIALVGQGVLGAQGWADVHLPLAGLPYGTAIYLQAATLDPAVPVLPYAMTNVGSATYYF
jgi:hypothetical protein